MNATTYAKLQLQRSFDLLNVATQGVDDSQYNWKPAGTCNPVSKMHAHALSAIDVFINGIIKGSAPNWPEFAAKNGWPADAMEVWGSDATFSLQSTEEYGKKMQEMALNYVSTLSDSDLDREVETRFFGKQSVGFVLQLLGEHTAAHAGDISAVKGMQGLKGLPF